LVFSVCLYAFEFLLFLSNVCVTVMKDRGEKGKLIIVQI